jgi:hypothetical protein
MAAPTNAANVKKALANSGPSTHGTSRHSRRCNIFGRYWGHSGRWSARGLNRSVANDPKRTSGLHDSSRAIRLACSVIILNC